MLESMGSTLEIHTNLCAEGQKSDNVVCDKCKKEYHEHLMEIHMALNTTEEEYQNDIEMKVQINVTNENMYP